MLWDRKYVYRVNSLDMKGIEYWDTGSQNVGSNNFYLLLVTQVIASVWWYILNKLYDSF